MGHCSVQRWVDIGLAWEYYLVIVYPFSEEEYRRGIATLKNKKAAGIDDVLVEQLKNLTSVCLQNSTTSSLRTRSQQYGVNRRSSPYENPGKTLRHLKVTGQYPFCVTLYERLILNRITPTIERTGRLSTRKVMFKSSNCWFWLNT